MDLEQLDVLNLMCDPSSPGSPTPPPSPAVDAVEDPCLEATPRPCDKTRPSTERPSDRDEPPTGHSPPQEADASEERTVPPPTSSRDKRRRKVDRLWERLGERSSATGHTQRGVEASEERSELPSRRDKRRRQETRVPRLDKRAARSRLEEGEIVRSPEWKRPQPWLEASDRQGEDRPPAPEEDWRPPFASRYTPAKRPNGHQKQRSPFWGPQVFFHRRGMAVLCIKHWGYTLTNGVVSHAVDHDTRYGERLLESVAHLDVDRLYVTDEETRLRWESLVRSQYQYHPARQVQVVRIPERESVENCVFCGQGDCHRWLAVVGGMSKWADYPVEPIRH